MAKSLCNDAMRCKWSFGNLLCCTWSYYICAYCLHAGPTGAVVAPMGAKYADIFCRLRYVGSVPVPRHNIAILLSTYEALLTFSDSSCHTALIIKSTRAKLLAIA